MMTFRQWLEDEMVASTGLAGPEDNCLGVSKPYDPRVPYSDKATDLFITKDPKKKRALKARFDMPKNQGSEPLTKA